MNEAKAAEEGRAPAHQKDHHHHIRQHRRNKRDAAKRRKIESKLPSALHGKDIKQTQRRLSIKNEAIAALAEFCGTFRMSKACRCRA
jgi:hypothetical protein